jgi:hypothetical protein
MFRRLGLCTVRNNASSVTSPRNFLWSIGLWRALKTRDVFIVGLRNAQATENQALSIRGRRQAWAAIAETEGQIGRLEENHR